MNSEVIKEVLHILFSRLEKLETDTEALLQFMKEKEAVTDAQLAPYLETAGNASNVRWRAARVRIEYLIAEAEMEESREKEEKAKAAKNSYPSSGMEQAVASDQPNASKGRHAAKIRSDSAEHERSTQDEESNPEKSTGDREAA